MSRGVQFLLLGLIAVTVLVAVAGCGHNFYSGERETWRREAEAACVNSGALRENADRVRITAISGPGICGADYPIRVSALGDTSPLGYDDEPLRPPGSVPEGSVPQHWPVAQSNPLPPPQYGPPPQHGQQQYGQQQYGQQQYGQPAAQAPPGRPSPSAPAQLGPMQSGRALQQAAPVHTASAPGRPLSLYPPGVPDPGEDDAAFEPTPPQPYGEPPGGRERGAPPPTYTPRPLPGPAAAEEHVPLGWPRDPSVTSSGGPVAVKPAATLACPIVSALDQWIATAVQPAAHRWFRVPVAEIKQISAYSCRGMNGNPYAHISEHAFGNALDISEFVLADGHRITVQYGWHGTPEEQGFLHDVQLAACNEFSTVLAPGANIYHYNHIHVDLMRRVSGRRICEPAAIPGEVVAERARARYAGQRGEPSSTGSIGRTIRRALGYSGEDDDRLPLAVPGED